MHFIQMFDRSVRHYPNSLAFTGDGGDMTYLEAQVMSNKVAHACLNKGIETGSRFSFMSPNSGTALTAALGAMRANCVWNNINMRDTQESLIDILSRGEVELIFYHSMVSQIIGAARQQVKTLKLTVCLDRPDENGVFLDDWIKDQPQTAPDIKIDPNDLGMQAVTGGTTGRPKLAVHAHIMTALSMLGFTETLKFEEPPIYLSVAPNTHAGGFISLTTLAQGGTVVMMAKPDPDSILDAIPRHGISLLFLPPTLTYVLLKHPRASEIDYSSLKYFVSSTSPIAPEKIKEAIELFGPVMAQMLGQSEAGMPLTYISPKEYLEAVLDESKSHRLASCGRQTQILDALEIVDENDNPLGPNEKGEIVFKGQTMMRYYLNAEEETAKIQKNGWHHSGDIGYRDEDGYIYICDRKRDMIISGGYNVFPYQIEHVLLGHPEVQECAVFGVPDEKWGEAVKAAIIKAPNSQVSEQELIGYCKEKLGSVKTPKSIDFVDEFPKSPVGKILKREIRSKYWVDHSRQVG